MNVLRFKLCFFLYFFLSEKTSRKNASIINLEEIPGKNIDLVCTSGVVLILISR